MNIDKFKQFLKCFNIYSSNSPTKKIKNKSTRKTASEKFKKKVESQSDDENEQDIEENIEL